MMLNELYKRPLERTPDKDAIIFKDRSLSYSELDENTRKHAATLSSLGIGFNDRVALFMGNRPELIELYLACFVIGAVAVPLNPVFRPTRSSTPARRARPSS